MRLVPSTSRVKTPTVIQMEAAECGAAALGVVLSYHGCHVPLIELRFKCGVSRDGCDAYNLVEAAKHYGLEAEGYTMSIEELRKQRLPAILFWDYNHFVVLEHFGRSVVYLNDPATGPRQADYSEFETAFSGVVILVKPTASFRKMGRPQTFWATLPQRLRPVSRTFLTLLVLHVVLAVLGLLAVAFPRIFLDEVLPQRMLMPKGWLFVGMAGFTLLLVLVYALEAQVLNRMRCKLSICLSAEFLWHILRLPISFFSQRFGGEVIDRIDLNVSVSDRLCREFLGTIPNLAFVGLYAVVMLQYDRWITLVGIGAAALNLGAFALVNRARKNAYARLQQDEAKATGLAIDTLQHMETIKATGTDSFFYSRLLGQFTKNLNALQSIGHKDLVLASCSSVLQDLSVATLLGVGAWRVIHGDLTIGMLFALQFLLSSFLNPVSELVEQGAVMQEFKVDLMRLADVTNNQLDPTLTNELNLAPPETPAGDEKLSGLLEFRSVRFGYSPLDDPVVEDLSLELRPGQRLALVGATGSGKSTAAKLAAGLLEPWSGEVLYDQRSRRQIRRKQLITSIAAVDQQIFLFSGSIRDNLSLWDTTLPEKDLVQGAKDACIHEDIVHLPDGYDSVLEEDGRNLSAGQRQRLELARALAQNPTLLVLDEATSALDSETEAAVMRNLRRRGCACLIIAHRLSTIRHSDQILVLDCGRVVQRGKHEELVAVQGHYRKLILSESHD